MCIPTGCRVYSQASKSQRSNQQLPILHCQSSSSMTSSDSSPCVILSSERASAASCEPCEYVSVCSQQLWSFNSPLCTCRHCLGRAAATSAWPGSADMHLTYGSVSAAMTRALPVMLHKAQLGVKQQIRNQLSCMLRNSSMSRTASLIDGKKQDAKTAGLQLGSTHLPSQTGCSHDSPIGGPADILKLCLIQGCSSGVCEPCWGLEG